MSRTYNTKHDFNKKWHDYEFPQGYVTNNGREIKPGEVVDFDPSFTTYGDNEHAINHNTTCRHPNKRKKRGSLGREFTKVGMTGTRYWRNRFGEEDGKSSRCRLVKHQMTHTRRHRIKNETQEIIKEELWNVQ